MKLYELVITKPKITSPFGYRKDPKDGSRKYHAGIDLVSKVCNRNLFAVDNGYVQKVVNNQSKSKKAMAIIFGLDILDMTYLYFMDIVQV